MKNFNNKNVFYLEKQDVTPGGKIKKVVTKGKPTIVMVTADYCHYCTKAKPSFARLSEQTRGKFNCATIVMDGKQSEQALKPYLTQWDPNFRGIPTYFIFKETGSIDKVYSGARDTKSLKEAMKEAMK